MKEAYILKRREKIPSESKHKANSCSMLRYCSAVLIKYRVGFMMLQNP